MQRVPHLDGLLTAEQIRSTAASIAATQERSGAIPWTPDGHTDVWNHVEAAMALLAAGEREVAERAYAWVAETQRVDGSWPLKVVGGRVEDPSGDANGSAYVAVGIWHHWLIRRDRDFVRRHWPAVRRGIDFAVAMQLPFGGIAWSQEWRVDRPAKVNREALLAGSSSIYQSLRAGVALADLLGDPQPEWELAGGRLGHAVRRHREFFLGKSEFSMDWYYPVLARAIRGPEAHDRIAGSWSRFVRPGRGILCVADSPWVTGAETCELAMALTGLGEEDRARTLLADMQHLRAEDGAYWTGLVYPEDVKWPAERTSYTAAAVILAADTLSRSTPGSRVFRGELPAPHFAEIGLECGCEPLPDGIAGEPLRTP